MIDPDTSDADALDNESLWSIDVSGESERRTQRYHKALLNGCTS
jgi:hypothetical protein